MSRVDDLIKELCPNGVTFVILENLFHIKGGYTPPKSNPKNWETSEIPWFRMEDIRENGPVLDAALSGVSPAAVKNGQLFPADSLIVATSATIGEHALIRVPYLCNQRFVSLQVKEEFRNLVDIKFLHYYAYVLDEWCLSNTTQSSFASVQMKGFKKFKFPIPPLEIQQEIARILDKFTQLEAELEAELEARRKQYAYYREQLLGTDGPSANAVMLKDISHMRAGKSIPAAEISDKYSEGTPVPCFGGGGMRGYVAESNQTGGKVLIGRQGALCGNVAWASDDFYATEHAVVVTSRPELDPRWAFHKFIAMDLNQYASKSAQPGLAVQKLKNLQIDLPPLARQREVAAILDKFDALVNDISTGLPAEIAARRKQYEYYRDKLLSFEPV